MRHWAWRLFRREWRQQLLILVLVVIAVGATFVGAAVATNTPPPAAATFGTAQDLAQFGGTPAQVATQVAALRHRFGTLDVVAVRTRRVPGSSETYALRAQDPRGPYGGPMLSLVSGRYPASPDEVALTAGLVAALRVHVGGTWHDGTTVRHIVGVVSDPESLLSQFALVPPGQVPDPTQTTVLFDAHGVPPATIGRTVRAASQSSSTPTLNPETISLTVTTVGMLLIALVSVGGFTVLAHRRLRAIGMVESLGATDAHVRLVVVANGVIVGVVGAVAGAALGLAAWLAYRPTLEQDAHHVMGVLAVPWLVVGVSMALAVVATTLAASRPARSIARVPVVTALEGRPGPLRDVRRSAVPGVAVLGAAAALFTASSAARSINLLVPAFVALIVAIVLLAPSLLAAVGRLRVPGSVAARLALRDLARYRARSASALAAISLGTMIAVVIVVIAGGRYGNPLDYTGANLASNQVLVRVTTTGTQGGKPTIGTPRSPTPAPQQESPSRLAAAERAVAAALGATRSIELEHSGVTLLHAAKGRNFSGPVYVATPQLLRAFGVQPAQVQPGADILTARPGLASESSMLLIHGNYFSPGGPAGGGPAPGTTVFPCPAATCTANPVIQEVPALPTGTSAPNTVLTERALHALHLRASLGGWLVETAQPPSASQIANARAIAAGTNLYVETKSSAPSSAEVVNSATLFGIALALGILAMSVGLIRSETAAELRTLTAAGAASYTRRALSGATAGGLALLGAVLGALAGFVACVSWFASTHNTGLGALAYAPVRNLVLLVVGTPLAAVVVGWLLAGREPPVLARQPIE